MIVWWLDLQIPMQSVPFTTNVVSSKYRAGKVYSIQNYMIKFVSGLRQVGDFSGHSANKTGRHDTTEILLK